MTMTMTIITFRFHFRLFDSILSFLTVMEKMNECLEIKRLDRGTRKARSFSSPAHKHEPFCVENNYLARGGCHSAFFFFCFSFLFALRLVAFGVVDLCCLRSGFGC